MSKRPPVDLMALTAEQATPMPEAVQRTQPVKPVVATIKKERATKPSNTVIEHVGTANLEALAFKVSPEFRKRFKTRAVNADLKLNELLFEALDAWEKQKGIA
jgi:hypothetical protein